MVEGEVVVKSDFMQKEVTDKSGSMSRIRKRLMDTTIPRQWEPRKYRIRKCDLLRQVFMSGECKWGNYMVWKPSS
ncbi:hypothetical protein [Escherichia coli]|uniref:hypothetical protein n=1 Tax=Escherichia coli TaxID=562 RepID=UPI001CDCADE1|nr:hypothetical protein [Escherichia coli]